LRVDFLGTTLNVFLLFFKEARLSVWSEILLYPAAALSKTCKELLYEQTQLADLIVSQL